jgi:hypothetical protein
MKYSEILIYNNFSEEKPNFKRNSKIKYLII